MRIKTFILALLLANGAMAQTTPLHNELARKDSLLFAIAMGSCNLQALDNIFTKDFVMYHDNGYGNPSTAQPYADLLAFIKKTCESKPVKMRREVVLQSLQTFPVSEREATQTGVQRFFVTPPGQPERQVEESKFFRTWRKEGPEWKLARETDYMVKNSFPAEVRYQPEPYTPPSAELHATIVRLDSIYFDTYNNCNIEKMASMMSDTLEFYHDRGGLSTSKTENLASIRKNICGKVTRELVKGSIEVYPIAGYGAVEIGYHSFRNIAEPGVSRPSKFIVLWRHADNEWKITRVVSLH